MSGSIHKRHDGKAYFVNWYCPIAKKAYHIHWYKGETIRHPAYARKLLSLMQGDWENYRAGFGPWRIEKYTGKGWTDVIEFYEQWLKLKSKKKPATYKGYKSYFKNWIKPFFEKHPIMLHEIQLETLYKLMDFINLKPKGKYNVMNAFHTFMVYAKRSRRIPEMPDFPQQEDYDLKDPPIKWIDSKTFWQIVANIPGPDKPVILWMYYHLMREAEACALQWQDWDEINRVFTVQRSISARKLVDSTKTGEVYLTPCHSDFYPFMKKLIKNRMQRPFIFTNKRARSAGQRYTNESLNNIWKAACKPLNINIRLYAAIRHSRATQMSVELGMSEAEIFEAGTWKRRSSVRKYKSLELSRKQELLERNVVSLSNGYQKRKNGK